MSSDVFLRLYVSAFKRGLFWELGDERWATLCVMAAFMEYDSVMGLIA